MHRYMTRFLNAQIEHNDLHDEKVWTHPIKYEYTLLFNLLYFSTAYILEEI